MFIKIIIFMAVVMGAMFLIISRQPENFKVTRSININAPADKVFQEINNFRNWEAWSPWAKLDLNAKNSFSGAESGVGSMFSWSGNRKVGAGTLTIMESRRDEFIKIQMNFIKPFKATNYAEFTFSEAGNQTNITWTMYGQNNFVSKAMSLFINCDKMIGGMFEKGLASLKAVAESK